ncbi:hypothetical protein Patl1_28974 [Pistacia atlantica]|uniref:Uncharacterized protein n=1 Tax=Pistacia atlantica TaxID=434234 RepID=A0ACC1BDN4_9ROSI|nr:hypothetical protein Patl1_28974 [Pistacia atlantica]
MAAVKIPHMNAGDGETSYAKNSLLQKTVILKVRPFLEETIKDMFSSSSPTCFKVADLGCSSGPNTLLVVSEIIDIIQGICHQRQTVNHLSFKCFSTISQKMTSTASSSLFLLSTRFSRGRT